MWQLKNSQCREWAVRERRKDCISSLRQEEQKHQYRGVNKGHKCAELATQVQKRYVSHLSDSLALRITVSSACVIS